MKNQVMILDFGGEHTQIVSRMVRAKKVYCMVLSGDASKGDILSALKGEAPGAVILSGDLKSDLFLGPEDFDDKVLDLNCPFLAMGWGMGILAESYGGHAKSERMPEAVKSIFTRSMETNLLHGMPENLELASDVQNVLVEPPRGFEILGQIQGTYPAAIGNEERSIYGVGVFFGTEFLEKILDNFLFGIAGLKPDWTIGKFIEKAIQEIKGTASGSEVLSAVSGGVDSTVATLLVHKAVGDKLRSVMVDHGFLRKGEAAYVRDSLGKLGLKVNLLNARERFLKKLSGIVDPEEKRKRIGAEFIKVFEEEATKYGDVKYMVQGTIYPDIIESGSKARGIVKSHHNVGGLPKEMKLQILEPLKESFKDEVRQVGEEMGLPAEFVCRQPFPGPGLAIRILGEVTQEKLDVLRAADAIFLDEIKKAGLYQKIWQSFCVLPGVRTVGVSEGKRTYGHVLALRAVTSEDAMSADWAKIPFPVLDKVSTRILKEEPSINKVVLDITSKPPSTIEWE